MKINTIFFKFAHWEFEITKNAKNEFELFAVLLFFKKISFISEDFYAGNELNTQRRI